MLKLTICDDDNHQVQFLCDVAKLWSKINNLDITIQTYNSAEKLLFSCDNTDCSDIFLLDIELGENRLNGVELAKKIRQHNDKAQIIFVTGFSDYILDGYEVSALHYLMKPVSAEKLQETLSRAVEKISYNDKYIHIKTENSSIRVYFNEITYIEAMRNYVVLHTKSGENYSSKISLSEIEATLDERFFRTGRSFLVSLSYIKKVAKTEVLLVNGEQIPLPRGMYEKLNRAIIDRM